MQFDDKGNLYPYDLVDSDLEAINQELHLNSPRRFALLSKLDVYCRELSRVVDQGFKQHIGGSFVSLKPVPNDIDVANLIRLHDPDDEQISSVLRFLTLGGSLDTYQIDGHLIPVYAFDDERYATTLARIAYFRKWFGQDRDGNARGISLLTHRI